MQYIVNCFIEIIIRNYEISAFSKLGAHSLGPARWQTKPVVVKVKQVSGLPDTPQHDVELALFYTRFRSGYIRDQFHQQLVPLGFS